MLFQRVFIIVSIKCRFAIVLIIIDRFICLSMFCNVIILLCSFRVLTLFVYISKNNTWTSTCESSQWYVQILFIVWTDYNNNMNWAINQFRAISFDSVWLCVCVVTRHKCTVMTKIFAEILIRALFPLVWILCCY